MRKSLTWIVITLPISAFADSQIYGEIKSGMETTHTHLGAQSFSDTSVSDLSSHIGIRGSYPIGGNTKLTWQAEYNTDVGDSLRSRWQQRKNRGESFIGIE